MGQVQITKQGPEAFIDNDRYDDLDFTSGVREFQPPRQTRMSYQAMAVLFIGGILTLVVLLLLYGVWKTIYCWNGNHYITCERINWFEPNAVLLVFGVIIGLVVWFVTARITAYVRQQRAIANRSNLVLNRFGDQQPADLFERLDNNQTVEFLLNQYALANNLQRAVAPYQIYKSVNSLSVSNSNQLVADSNDEDTSIVPVAPNEWLTWINQQPHVMLAGATGKGKTTTTKPILAPRITSGEQFLIVDPHADYWFGLPVFGGGENWQEVKEVLEEIYREYKARHAERDRVLKAENRAMKPSEFQRVTVVLDEAFAASMHLSNTAKRGQISTWDLFSEALGSGARKVNLSIILLTQTANVEDLGLSGPLRENFTRIAVDARAIKLMIAQEEKDATRRVQLYETLIGMQYPATTVIDASVVLLDRTGLDQTPDPSVTPANFYPFVRSQGVDPANNDSSRTNEPNVIYLLSVLRSQGVTRDEARHKYGLTFTDTDWTAAAA